MKSTCCHRHETVLTRREALLKSGAGVGAMALAHLMVRDVRWRQLQLPIRLQPT